MSRRSCELFRKESKNRNHRNRKNQPLSRFVAYRTNFPRDDYNIETYTILYSANSSVQLALRNYSFLLALLSVPWKHALPFWILTMREYVASVTDLCQCNSWWAQWLLMYVRNSYKIRKNCFLAQCIIIVKCY